MRTSGSRRGGTGLSSSRKSSGTPPGSRQRAIEHRVYLNGELLFTEEDDTMTGGR
jgi:hypothetical protein